MIVAALTGTCLLIAVAALISMMAFPPTNVPLQMQVAALWFAAGFFVARLWA